MLWLCLVACNSLLLTRQDNSAVPDGSEASVSVEQPATIANLKIEQGASEGSLTVTDLH